MLKRPIAALVAVLTLSAGGLALAASPAAAAGTGTVSTGSSTPLNIRSQPNTSSTVIGSLANGTNVTLDCWITGSTVNGRWGATSLWHHARGGYISDGFVYTGTNGPAPGEAKCGTSSTPAGKRGQTIGYNTAPWGQCTWYVYERAKGAIGVYPYIMGNAKDMANNASARGWTVTSTPRSQAMLVRQPGNPRANATYGHVMWVEAVLASNKVRVKDMNVAGLGVVTQADVTLVGSDRFIYIN